MKYTVRMILNLAEGVKEITAYFGTEKGAKVFVRGYGRMVVDAVLTEKGSKKRWVWKDGDWSFDA